MSGSLTRIQSALGERYTVQRKLGQGGGMATVFLAEDLKHHRPVAVKVLRPELAEVIGAKRFLREIEISAGLHHPHILPLYDSGEADGLLYYVMPYAEGESLRDRLNREKQLPLDDALQIAREVADALSYAHSRGVVHRDIKPDNILLHSDHAVVADFGIAWAISEAGGEHLTETGWAIGTPAYMSPEQAAGSKHLDGRSDVYSLGCVLYEMLAGQAPFTGPTVDSIMHQRLTVEAPPIRNLRPAVPVAVATALQRALAKIPADRYPTVSALRGALTPPPTPIEHAEAGAVVERALDEAPANADDVADARSPSESALPSGAIERASGARRRRVLWASGVLGVVGAAMAAGMWLGDRTEAPETEKAVVPESEGRDPHSIAVLPFADLSPAGDQEYFSDGLAEELLNTLAQIPGLKVVGRTSSFQFKGRNEDLRTIGEKLNVAMILEGGVRRANRQARITAQLVSTSDGFHVWSQTYDVELNDILAVQDEIAAAVARQLEINLLGEIPKPKAVSSEAYALFLQAREVARQATAKGWAESNALFERALVLEPGYAPAWGALADNYMNQVGNGLRPIAEGVPLAREAVSKALALDSSFALGYGSLGWLTMGFDSDLAAAARHFEHALVLAPANTDLLRNAATLAQHLGRLETAMALGEYVVAQDPVDPRGYHNLGTAQYYAGRLDEAIASMHSALRLAPGHISAQSTIGEALLAKGEPDAALAEMQKESSEIWRVIHLPMAYHALGRKVESDAAVAELIQKYEKDAPYNIAYVLSYRGEADRAFAWLDRAVESGDPGLLDIAVQPEFASIRNDRRWMPFLRKLGRAPEQLAAIRFEVKPPR